MAPRKRSAAPLEGTVKTQKTLEFFGRSGSDTASLTDSTDAPTDMLHSSVDESFDVNSIAADGDVVEEPTPLPGESIDDVLNAVALDASAEWIEKRVGKPLTKENVEEFEKCFSDFGDKV